MYCGSQSKLAFPVPITVTVTKLVFQKKLNLVWKLFGNWPDIARQCHDSVLVQEMVTSI
jgi:hypothetical protein